MTISGRMRLSLALMGGMTVLLAAFAAFASRQVGNRVDRMANNTLPAIYALGEIDGLAKDLRGKMRAHAVSTDPAEEQQIDKDIAGLWKKLETGLDRYSKESVNSEGERALTGQLDGKAREFLQVWQQRVRPISVGPDTAGAMQLFLADGMGAFKQLQKSADALRDHKKREADDAAAEAQGLVAQIAVWSLGALIGSILLALALGWFQVRSVEVVLRNVIEEMSTSATQVEAAARQVSEASHNLAQGASEQTSSIEQTSAVGTVVGQKSERNAKDASEMAELMRTLGGDVQSANRALAKMTDGMQEIGTSSNRISQIIRVIDEIAFQTNILALNAAVEAARAGQAGMGFSVVADEVRTLAQRSAQAARDTAELIEASVLSAKTGQVDLADINNVFREITERAERVQVLVESVQGGSRDQARSIGEIGETLGQLESVTQANAASAQQTAAAAHELTAQAQSLTTTVGELRKLVNG